MTPALLEINSDPRVARCGPPGSSRDSDEKLDYLSLAVGRRGMDMRAKVIVRLGRLGHQQLPDSRLRVHRQSRSGLAGLEQQKCFACESASVRLQEPAWSAVENLLARYASRFSDQIYHRQSPLSCIFTSWAFRNLTRMIGQDISGGKSR